VHLPAELYVVAAPSGAGKTTLNRRFIASHPHFCLSISKTTRPQRAGEKNGEDYWFVTEATFKNFIEQGAMLEWAHVHGNYYGTSQLELDRIQEMGCAPLLEIDVQGWQQVRKKIPAARAIFICPPSMRTLWDRLSARQSDTPEKNWVRFQNARQEIEQCESFQYFIINDSLETAYQDLCQVIAEHQPARLSYEQGLAHCKQLLQEFDMDPVIQAIKVQYGSFSDPKPS